MHIFVSSKFIPIWNQPSSFPAQPGLHCDRSLGLNHKLETNNDNSDFIDEETELATLILSFFVTTGSSYFCLKCKAVRQQ